MAGSATTLPNITIANTAPVIENITYQSGLSLVEGVPTNLIFSFLAMDFDGADDFVNASAYMNVTLDGADTRENNTVGSAVTCYPETVGSNDTAQNYTCTIEMQYWDLSGNWNCTAQVSDSSVNTSLVVDNCFTVGTTTAINATATTLAWGSLGVGQMDSMMSTSELNVTNIGNQNLTNITLQGINLIGETTNSIWIPAANFTASWGERTCNTGPTLINDTDIQILGNGIASGAGILDFGPGSLMTTNNATHICLEEVGQDISQQSYSTAGDIEPWTITGVV